MKTIIFFPVICLMAISSVLFISCDDREGDTTPPVINLIVPEEGGILSIGDEHGVHFEIDLSDNEMLASYKVEIHNNFDGHEHTHDMRSGDETVAFYFDKSWDLPGKRNTLLHHHEIMIPENATPGSYHLIVHCTDVAGNESHIARNIILSHEGEDYDHDVH